MCVPVGLIHPHTFCFFMTIAHREEEDSQKCLNIALDKGIRPLFLNLVSHFSHFPHFLTTALTVLLTSKSPM